MLTATYNGDNVGTKTVGAAVGTVVGFRVGGLVETSNTLRAATVASLINDNYPLATFISTSIEPVGAIGSSIVQETVQQGVDYISSKK